MESLGDYTTRTGRLAFARTLIALALSKGSTTDATDFARQMVRNGTWIDTSDVPDMIAPATNDSTRMRMKGVIAPTDTDSGWGIAQSAFFDSLYDETIISRLPLARRVPPATQAVHASIVGAGAAWVAPSDSIPVYAMNFDDFANESLTIGGIVVATAEFVRLAIRDPSSAATIEQALRSATVDKLNNSFASTDAAVSGEAPAGIFNAAQTIASTGSTVAQIAKDVGDMLGVFRSRNISLRSVIFVISPEAYATLAMLKILDAEGTLAGRPVVALAPTGIFGAVATEYVGISLADDVNVRASSEGTIQMRDDPDGTATNVVSLWQKNLVAMRSVLYGNWSVAGPSDTNGYFATVLLTGAAWA